MPRAGVTVARIDEVAGDTADASGYDSLTMASVASELGVTVPSLYKHVEGLDGMRRRLSIASTARLAAVVSSAAIGKSRGDALDSFCRAYRDYARSHPGRYAATVVAPRAADEAHQAVVQSVLEPVLAVLAGYGLVQEDAIDAARLVRSSLHGFVALELIGGFGLSRDLDASFDQLVTALDRALSDWPVTSRAG